MPHASVWLTVSETVFRTALILFCITKDSELNMMHSVMQLEGVMQEQTSSTEQYAESWCIYLVPGHLGNQILYCGT
jgi:hypothetical protein